jgi:hypothetical protein
VKRAQRGSPWGGEVKLGYRAIREPHQASWVIEEDEAALVRRIYQMALAKCDREAHRWADAYATEVINVAELKGYRAEIATRRQAGMCRSDATGEIVVVAAKVDMTIDRPGRTYFPEASMCRSVGGRRSSGPMETIFSPLMAMLVS